MGKTKIQRTDATWSPVVGCTKVSPGCDNCDAERMAYRLACMGQKKYQATTGTLGYMRGWNGKTFCDDKSLEIPLHWRKPRMIFVCSMSDLFHKSVPFEFIDKVVDVFNKCPQHTGQLLTKRAERLLEYSKYRNFQWPDNVIGMVTAENQPMADLRIPLLVQCGFKTTGVSIEPMLGAVDLEKLETNRTWPCKAETEKINTLYGYGSSSRSSNPKGPRFCDREYQKLDWVIVGGESGPGARAMHPDWPRGIRDQCVAAGVPFFFKGWGAWLSGDEKYKLRINTYQGYYPKRVTRIGKTTFFKVGKKKAGRQLDGRTWDELPELAGKVDSRGKRDEIPIYREKGE